MRDRQTQLAMRALVEYASEELIEYWNTIEDDPDLDPFAGSPEGNHIAETIIFLDMAVNQGRAVKRLYKELDYFKDHRESLNRFINSGR